MIEFLTVTLIILLAAISPGPDFAIVMQNALQRGQRPGIMTALGVSCSLVIHATYSILGLAIVISQSLLLFSLIKYLGAAYLIYIGVKNVFAKSNTNTQNESSFISKTHSRQDFTEGFLCNLLNPKAIMFILAFFTLVIKSTSTLAAQFGYAIESHWYILFGFQHWLLWLTIKRLETNYNKFNTTSLSYWVLP